jgi:hypothetical protein
MLGKLLLTRPREGADNGTDCVACGQPATDCDFNQAVLYPAHPIKRRTSAQRTQASQGVNIRKALQRKHALPGKMESADAASVQHPGGYRACWMAERIHRSPGLRTKVQSSVALTRSVGLPSTIRPKLSRVTSIIEKRIATVA